MPDDPGASPASEWAPDAGLMAVLAEHFTELTRVLLDPSDVPLEPRRLVQFATRAVAHATDASLTLVRLGRPPQTVAASSDLPGKIDLLQYELGDGPALDAIEENDVVQTDDLQGDTRWPVFAARATALSPLRSMLAVRLLLPGPSCGSLNLYSTQPGAFDEVDRGVAVIFASFASLAFTAAENRDQALQLQGGLESNRQIGIAMGVLMARRLLTSEQAFDALRTASQNLNVKLRDIARHVAETGDVPTTAAEH